jgi:phage head maturation protease
MTTDATVTYRYIAERGAQLRLAPTTADETERVVDVVWSTGARVYRPATSRAPAHIEELVLSPEACRLDQLNAGAPLLAVHRHDSLDAVLGSVVPGSARIEDGVATAQIRFSRRPDVEPIWNDVRDGHLRACSVAYRVDRVERDAQSRPGQPEVWRVTDWTPIEISLVPIGADPQARIRAFFGEELAVAEVEQNPTQQVDAPAAVEAPRPVDVEAQARSAVERERERIAAIIELGQRFSLGDTAVRDFITRGVSIEAARAQVLEMLAARSSSAPVYPVVTTPRGGLDETETRRAAIEAAIAHRALPGTFDLPEPAREYRGMTLLDLAREILRQRGEVVTGMTRSEIASRAHTTSDFPLILANVATKSLRAGYENVPRDWQQFCQPRNVPDLKDQYPTFFGEAPALQPVVEGQELPRGTIVEGRESYRLSRYAVEIAISDRIVINDDLDALGRLPLAIGAQAAELENQIVWGIFTANPPMRDGNPLFHASHANVASTGTALSVASLGAARAEMMRQRGLDGKTAISIRPSFLVVPPELLLVAEQITGATQPTAPADVVPDSLRRLRVVVSQYFPKTTPAPWYLVAAPLLVQTIEYARLEGANDVQINTYRDPSRLCTVIQAVHHFAAKALDWRGFYRNPGA